MNLQVNEVNFPNLGVMSKFLVKSNDNIDCLKEKILKNQKLKLKQTKNDSVSKFLPFTTPSSTAIGSNESPAKNFCDFKSFEVKSLDTFSRNKSLKKIELKGKTLKNLSKHSPLVKEAKIDYYIKKQLEQEEKEK